MTRPVLFERIGEAKLRAVIAHFYAQVEGDVMIGFMFAGKDVARLIELEYQFTAHFLGADVRYSGRPMRAAHAGVAVFGGHFERRQELLRRSLAAHAVDAEVSATWLGHNEALRGQVTADRGSECGETSMAEAATSAPGPDRPIRLGRRRGSGASG